MTWNDVSLYQNEFDENIARIAFNGGLIGEKFSSTTPEIATDGMFPKCWKRFDKDVYLLKQGSTGAKNAGRESFSELYAYDLAKIICDDPVEYEDEIEVKGVCLSNALLTKDCFEGKMEFQYESDGHVFVYEVPIVINISNEYIVLQHNWTPEEIANIEHGDAQEANKALTFEDINEIDEYER